MHRLAAVDAVPGSPATAASALAPPGRLVALSGQLGVGGTASEEEVPLERQVRRAFSNLGAELGRAGLRWSDVLRLNTYLVGRDAFPVFHSVRSEVFREIYPDGVYPPNTTVLVAGLFRETARVEIDVLAVWAEGERS